MTGGPAQLTPARPAAAAWAVVVPLALAQFLASYAAASMNVAISAIAADLSTTIAGVQATITLFTLTMAALMIPGSKLTDIWGRKRCFVAGLVLYGVGALLAAVARGLPLMVVGNSLLEGVGSALLIPPVYILITVAFTDPAARAKYFGVVSGAGGLGAATGPLVGGLITSTISWRASFGLQILVVVVIIVLARRITDPPRRGPAPPFDAVGAVLSGAGLFLVVLGVLQTTGYGWFVARKDFAVADTVLIRAGQVSPVWLFVGAGVLVLVWFFVHLRRRERKGRSPLLPLRLFHHRTANLGLGTQLVQWLVLQGSFFVISVYLQEAQGYDAIGTGLMLTPATLGILVSSAAAERLAARRSQRRLIIAGFTVTCAGMVTLLAMAATRTGFLSLAPGLLLMGAGIGVMLTSSVNVVQSSFPDPDQADISGLSRGVSNLGSSLGTALAGSILVAADHPGTPRFALALASLVLVAVVGLGLALRIPRAGSYRPGEAGSSARHAG